MLPFTDLSERRDQSFFSDGLSEELLTLLTRIPDLRVTASASSFAFRDRRNDIPAIARALNVANILDGSVRKSGNRLRVAVQLVQASTGTVVWSETYDRELKDVFKLQEDVASAVVDALKLRLLAEQHIPPGERTTNVAAYEQFLKGLKFREADTVDGDRQAIEAFQSAVRMDPGFARAYAGIAIARQPSAAARWIGTCTSWRAAMPTRPSGSPRRWPRATSPARWCACMPTGISPAPASTWTMRWPSNPTALAPSSCWACT